MTYLMRNPPFFSFESFTLAGPRGTARRPPSWIGDPLR